jgi:hypothetical protein
MTRIPTIILKNVLQDDVPFKVRPYFMPLRVADVCIGKNTDYEYNIKQSTTNSRFAIVEMSQQGLKSEKCECHEKIIKWAVNKMKPNLLGYFCKPLPSVDFLKTLQGVSSDRAKPRKSPRAIETYGNSFRLVEADLRTCFRNDIIEGQSISTPVLENIYTDPAELLSEWNKASEASNGQV